MNHRLNKQHHAQLRLILFAIASLGYANLTFLIYSLFSLKAFGISLILLAVPPIIAMIGTVFFYCFWRRIFPEIPVQAGRLYMRPYILGTAITVLSVALLLAIA